MKVKNDKKSTNIKEKEFHGSIIIADPFTILKAKDEEKFYLADDYSIESIELLFTALGFKTFIIGQSPDLSYIEYEIEEMYSEKTLGRICTKSSYIGVFLLSEVLKYNSSIVDIIKEQNVTYIEDYHGCIEVFSDRLDMGREACFDEDDTCEGIIEFPLFISHGTKNFITFLD